MLKRMLASLLAPAPGQERAAVERARALRTTGHVVEARRQLEGLVRAGRGDPTVHEEIALCFSAERNWASAARAWEAVIAIAPDHRRAGFALADVGLRKLGRYRQAIDFYRTVRSDDARFGDAQASLAAALYEVGEVDASLEIYRAQLARVPAAPMRQDYVFRLNAAATASPDEIFREHQAWGAIHADPVPRRHPAVERVAGRRLRVGYVGGDFRTHATAGFLEPLLAHHDRSAFEVICYSNSLTEDAVTARMKACTDRWHLIAGMDDDAVADLIEADGVDVVVDLAGHTAPERLGVFARRPAPVQVAYLGYLNTTGMSAMDYRVTDALMDPAGESERFHTEQLLRLPHSLWCYRAPDDAPAVSRRAGTREIVFGSFNHVARLNNRVLALWARVLRAVPRSRLLMLGIPDPQTEERIAGVFAEAGVARERLEMRARAPRGAFWEALGEADIALDTFPYSGGATTCACLWMGVPVVTLPSRFGFGRSGATIVENAGLGGLAARDEEAYLAVAAALARDVATLDDLRRSLRDRLRGSRLADEAGLARAFETALWNAVHQRTERTTRE
jgi:predicted O-linked N-acetylglucosamine transferase (SPINDLY family)